MIPNPSSITAIVVAATLLQMGNGLFLAVLPLRMQATGLTPSDIGIVAAVYGAGFAAGCIIAPLVVRQVGHIRAFAGTAAVIACVALAFSVAEHVVVWSILRALTGISFATLFTVIEGWISARSSSTNRGRILAIYMIATKFALMLSPLATYFGDVTGSGFFMLVSAAWALSLLPLAATSAEPPQAPAGVKLQLRDLARSAPSAVAGCFAIGLITGPVVALSPIYATKVGLAPGPASFVIFALQLGSLLGQWPLGQLSDRMDRRIVLMIIMLGTVVMSGVMVVIGAMVPPAGLIIAFVFWGVFALCAYAVCVAHACDVVPSDRMVQTISGLLICWSVGTMLGPLPGAYAMELMGPRGLFLYAGTVALLLVLFIAWRLAVQARSARPGGFVVLTPTTPASAALNPRSSEPGRP